MVETRRLASFSGSRVVRSRFARKAAGGIAGTVGASSVALALSLSPAYAQTATPTKAPSAAATPAAGAAKARETRQNLLTEFLQKVAARLGVTEDQLRAAIKGVEHDMVNARLASGKLTQDQADKLNERLDSGKPGALARLLVARRLRHR